MKIIKIFIAIFSAMLVIAYIDTNRRQWAKVYQEINEWEFGQEGDTLYFISADLEDTFWITHDTSWVENTDMAIIDMNYGSDRLYGELETVWDSELSNGDWFIYPDQFSGNTYVINAEGDTIFKYIKREKE